LKKKIADFENASEKLETRKRLLEEKLNEIDKEIKLLNNDHGIDFLNFLNFKISFN